MKDFNILKLSAIFVGLFNNLNDKHEIPILNGFNFQIKVQPYLMVASQKLIKDKNIIITKEVIKAAVRKFVIEL